MALSAMDVSADVVSKFGGKIKTGSASEKEHRYWLRPILGTASVAATATDKDQVRALKIAFTL